MKHLINIHRSRNQVNNFWARGDLLFSIFEIEHQAFIIKKQHEVIFLWSSMWTCEAFMKPYLNYPFPSERKALEEGGLDSFHLK